VNLGSWFVLERWIADRPFREAHPPGQSDLDVARGTHAREILQDHWRNWIVESDWAWLAETGINTVRIPIGFYHACGADHSVLRGTEFADYQSVFDDAWNHILNAIVTANKYQIGVLLDLHAAPGKQNRDAHSGTSDPNARFFDGSFNMRHTIHVLTVVLTHITKFINSFNPPLPNFVGIELLNEPAPGQHTTALKQWYTDAIGSLRVIDAQVPIVIGDSWQTDDYAGYLSHAAGSLQHPHIILDHHLYRCFTEEDINVLAYDHAGRLWDPNGNTRQTFARVTDKLESAGCDVIVGEWSGALNPKSLDPLPNKDHARSQFIRAQVDLYEQYCAGNFFWTYKKQWEGDKGWSFRDTVRAGLFPNSIGLRLTRPLEHHSQDARLNAREVARSKSFGEHESYWSRYPGKYEHWRFNDGFIQGWDDAYAFFASAGGPVLPELGYKGAWSKIRERTHVINRGSGPCVWEYRHGFVQGVNAARLDVAATCC